MNHRSPVQPLKSFLPFHSMLPGMFFLPLSMRASSLPQTAAQGNPLVGSAESATVNRVGPPTTQSNTKQATVPAGPTESGR